MAEEGVGSAAVVERRVDLRDGILVMIKAQLSGREEK